MSDLISKKAAIDVLGELATFTEDWSCHTWMYTDDVYNAIKQLPPIKPKRGRWIPVTNGRSGHECDQCHEYAPSYQTGEEHLSDFCPNCGADMREVNHE